MAEQDKIVVLQKFDSAIEASLAKSKLDAYGIPCFLTEENMASLYPGASTLLQFNVRLHLFENDVERALQLMNENNLIIADDRLATCPRCQSGNIICDFPARFTLKLSSLLNLLFFGLLFPHTKILKCLDCQHEFKD